MKFITIADLENDLILNMSKIPKDIDIVVGIPRSGMLVASLISLHLNAPLADIDSFVSGKYYSMGSTKIKKNWITDYSQIQKVLIVEDSVCHGNSILKSKRKISNMGENKISYVYLAAYVTPDKADLVDIYFRKVGFPRLFEWNYMHNKYLKNTCFDIDGVLCDDPMAYQNDDGEKYMHFIKNAKCKYQPSFEIGYIVSSRLEKYRSATEEWLKMNNIEYGELVMSPHKTAEERREANDYAKFKASIYKEKTDTFLFVESEIKQAIEIARLTGKSVFCIENQTYYEGKSLNVKLVISTIKTKNTIKRLVYNYLSKYSFIMSTIRKLRIDKL